MTAQVITDADQGGAEWLAARREGITGTDISAILGANPWRTPLDVWLSKQPDYDPGPVGEPALWGHRLEPVVRDHYAREHPGTIVTTVPGVLGHPDEPLLRGSLDGLAHAKDADRVLEVKTTRTSWADDYLPDHYLMQALWYTAITGLDECHVAVLTAGQRYSERVVSADPAWFDAAADRALTWWTAYVEGQVMPPPDPVADAPKLARLWRPDPTAGVELDPTLVAQLRDAKAAAAAAKTDYEQLVARVQIEMADAVAGYVDGQRVVAWTPTKGRATVDTGLLREAFPDVAEQVVGVGEPGRTFRVVAS